MFLPRLFRHLFPLAIFAALATGSTAQDAPNPSHGTSPSGKIDWRVIPAKDGGGMFTLANHEPPEKPHTASTIINIYNFRPYFSPDEQWLIFTDGGSSLGNFLTLMQRVGGTKFIPLKGVDLVDLAVKAAQGSPQASKLTLADHLNLSFNGWSPDSKHVTMELSGHGAAHGERIEISPMKFDLDVAPLKVVLIK